MFMRVLWVVTACAALCGCQAHRQPVAGDAARGQATFRASCAICHNADSRDKKVGPGLRSVAQRESEAAIRAKIDHGGNGMPPFGDVLSAGEEDNLVAYLATL
jgi:mono/diheme cytochrome c family protein